jgi:hypothetical protein
MESKPWYENGLRFSCTQCGECCRNHGGYTYVNLTEVELREIPEFLGLTRAEFLRRYCTKRPGFHPSLRMDEPACPFLGADNRCQIYPVRPKQCRTWPFWKENLARETWEGPVKEVCPGIGEGALHSRAEIERIADETERWFEG